MIDLSGTTLVPGYIAAHTHLLAQMPHMNNMDAMAREATSYLAIQGVVKAASLLDLPASFLVVDAVFSG